jgi:outer membrane protein
MNMSLKKIFITVLVALTAQTLIGQRFAYVDTRYILNNIPAYESAQEQLKIIMDEWQEEISAVNDEANRLIKLYEVEKILLSEDLKKKREEEIDDKQKEAIKTEWSKYFTPFTIIPPISYSTGLE